MIGYARILIHSIINQQTFWEMYSHFTVSPGRNVVDEGSSDLVVNLGELGTNTSSKRCPDGVGE